MLDLCGLTVDGLVGQHARSWRDRVGPSASCTVVSIDVWVTCENGITTVIVTPHGTNGQEPLL